MVCLGSVVLAAESQTTFEVSFPKETHAGPITGRAFVIVSETGEEEPRLQTGGDAPQGVPIWGKNIVALEPGETVVMDGEAFGFPIEFIGDLPPGDYHVQGFISIYTEFERSDGHTLWMHDDRWEDQRWTISPGNLYSDVELVHVDPGQSTTIRLDCSNVIPPVKVPADTQWVKRVKFKSDLLSEFWGRPIFLGATVLLPRGYDEHPDNYYPVNYHQGHFSLDPPHGFRTEVPDEDDPDERDGYDFFQFWISDDAPRMIAVTFQHPTPYYDDSYAVDSGNVGPYGTAIMTELIPYIEERFRVMKEPWARVLSGGSTGGWEALALQIFHPDNFGGVWASCPDPVDFRYYELINIYDDANAYHREFDGIRAERPESRDTDGQVRFTVRDAYYYEQALGDRHRSGRQWAIWEAVYSPISDDGYPQAIWNWRTGEIDHEVAEHWLKYDLRHYLETNWSWIGPKLEGKLHIYTGSMDTYYLNNAVVLFEEFLEGTTEPYYDGVVVYGDREPHCWGPHHAELFGLFADHITENTPGSDDAPTR